MARTYLERGHRVAACSRSGPPPDLLRYANEEDDDNVNGGGGRRFYYESGVDVCDPEAVGSFLEATTKAFGVETNNNNNNNNIDVWINNAGILDPIKPIRDTSPTDFEENLRVNLMGTFHATKAYIHHCRGRAPSSSSSPPPDCTLVNISSGASTRGYAGWGAYCSSKAAVDRLTECALAEETADAAGNGGGGFVFRAYSIAPGVIDTGMQEAIRKTDPADFPDVGKFLDLKRKNAFNTPPYVAIEIEKLALLGGAQTGPVARRLPPEAEAEP